MILVMYRAEWSGPARRIDAVLESNRNELNCPAALTDDGEFLVMLQTGPAFAATPVFWRPAELAEIHQLWSDETTQWFAGGNFKFSSDSRLLIGNTRWHNAVRIAIENGSVSME
jgi:hypothetical protein